MSVHSVYYSRAVGRMGGEMLVCMLILLFIKDESESRDDS